ncbi:hypothetical protein CIPAW_04G097500 [Carya illinoinensis]|uniref:Uncharacterized protein n=1 Tax=Carya illinoinensis TaxID=32201 RepID=A0A8T1QSU2_CARIL|nr:hypothetical protein CIPAW_04G097500 [Carya illinoinensis]
MDQSTETPGKTPSRMRPLMERSQKTIESTATNDLLSPKSNSSWKT